jgi:AcrR family transcriptional regulator
MGHVLVIKRFPVLNQAVRLDSYRKTLNYRHDRGFVVASVNYAMEVIPVHAADHRVDDAAPLVHLLDPLNRCYLVAKDACRGAPWSVDCTKWNMYRMVRLAMPASQEHDQEHEHEPNARERLLTAAVQAAMDGGIADLSLRELAAAIGTSHRMLLYHFGSREGLLAAVTLAVEQSERAMALNAGVITADDARRYWQRYSDPALWPQERLFFELYTHALRGRPGTEGFFDHTVRDWLEALTGAGVAAGRAEGLARAGSRLSMAVVRGLLLDLLATGDTEGTSEAFELFVHLAEAAG